MRRRSDTPEVVDWDSLGERMAALPSDVRRRLVGKITRAVEAHEALQASNRHLFGDGSNAA